MSAAAGGLPNLGRLCLGAPTGMAPKRKLSQEEQEEKKAEKAAAAAEKAEKAAEEKWEKMTKVIADERNMTLETKYAKWDHEYVETREIGNGGKVIVWTQLDDKTGKLVGQCSKCKKLKHMLQFAPADSGSKTPANHHRLEALVEEFEKMQGTTPPFVQKEDHGDKEWRLRRIIAIIRTQECEKCKRPPGFTYPEFKVCKDWFSNRKKVFCATSGGCCKNKDAIGGRKSCNEVGMASWQVLEADHLDPSTKMRDEKDKSVALSSTNFWCARKNRKLNKSNSHLMEDELAKGIQWICRSCHQLEPTHSGSSPSDPENYERDYPQNKDVETVEEYKTRKARNKSSWGQHLITDPKRDYVNKCKRNQEIRGKCEYAGCGRKVEKGEERSFDFDHTEESSKRKCWCFKRITEETVETTEGVVTTQTKRGTFKYGEGPCWGPPWCNDKLSGTNGGVSGLVSKSTQDSTLEKMKESLDEEMAKCVLLCASCHSHRKPTNRERWFKDDMELDEEKDPRTLLKLLEFKSDSDDSDDADDSDDSDDSIKRRRLQLSQIREEFTAASREVIKRMKAEVAAELVPSEEEEEKNEDEKEGEVKVAVQLVASEEEDDE